MLHSRTAARQRLARQSPAAIFAVAIAAAMPAPASAAESGKQAAEVMQEWPDTAKKAAEAMIDKYGQPDGVTDMMIVWENNGPWQRTVVYKDEVQHDFPMPHKDVLEQFIPYDPDPQMFDELAEYDGSVIAERTKGELSARCDKEAANFLALNLANDILQGEKSVEEARKAYADAIEALMGGNPPEITQKFDFDVSRDNTGDPDETILRAARR